MPISTGWIKIIKTLIVNQFGVGTIQAA